MVNEEKRVTPAQIGALGVGLTVTIASVIITTPILFPINLLISLGLGSAAGYGALKVLDPRTRQDELEASTNAEYQQILQQIEDIAVRTGNVSLSLGLLSPGVSQRLAHISRMADMILARYRERSRDFAGVSNTLLILKEFEEELAHYLKVKRDELFMDKGQREKEIEETEAHGIPMFETALENLGKKLDAGETINNTISKGTLESMLRSLNLIETLNGRVVSASDKGGSP